MGSEQNYIRTLRTCGRFFGSLVALSAGLACINVYNDRWGTALELVPGMLLFSALAWSAFSTPAPANRAEPDAGLATSDACKPVPVGPHPTHHLAAAKHLPPSDKTDSFRHD
jgi:hypothetical protein